MRGERKRQQTMLSLLGGRPRTLGADKGYDTAALIDILRAEGVTPHVAQNISGRRGSNIDGRTVRHPGAR